MFPSFKFSRLGVVNFGRTSERSIRRNALSFPAPLSTRGISPFRKKAINRGPAASSIRKTCGFVIHSSLSSAPCVPGSRHMNSCGYRSIMVRAVESSTRVRPSISMGIYSPEVSCLLKENQSGADICPSASSSSRSFSRSIPASYFFVLSLTVYYGQIMA